jgi:hypothetical protein
MVIEIADDPHPRAVAMARWVLLAMGHALFRPGNRSFLWQVDRPDLGLYLPCGIGCARLLLSAAFGRPV